MAIRPGADGCVDAAVIVPTGDCCPPGIGEISYCAMACSFVELLPSGPLWDRPKAEMIAKFRNQTDDGICGAGTCEPIEPDENLSCQSLVAYGVYLSNVLMDTLLNALWPTLREANPHTAVTTLDEWLVRLGWEDCYNTACRSPALGPLGPFEIMGECGPIFCPVAIPTDLECAIKRAIVHSLMRAGMGGIRNLCWINWVIEPLGARLDAAPAGEDPTCRNQQFELVPISDVLPLCPTELCPAAIDKPQGTVSSIVVLDICNRPAGLPEELRPAVYSAECIVRSLMPNHLAKNVRRVC